MTTEEQLKAEILKHYKSIRAFTQIVDIPYSTVDTIFKRGISGTSIQTIIKICDALNIDIQQLSKGKITTCAQNSSIKPNDDELQIIKKYRALDEHGKRIVDLVLDEEHSRCAADAKLGYTFQLAARDGQGETITITKEQAEKAMHLQRLLESQPDEADI